MLFSVYNIKNISTNWLDHVLIAMTFWSCITEKMWENRFLIPIPVLYSHNSKLWTFQLSVGPFNTVSFKRTLLLFLKHKVFTSEIHILAQATNSFLSAFLSPDTWLYDTFSAAYVKICLWKLLSQIVCIAFNCILSPSSTLGFLIHH